MQNLQEQRVAGGHLECSNTVLALLCYENTGHLQEILYARHFKAQLVKNRQTTGVRLLDTMHLYDPR
jgi:hypothetical protein